MCVRNKDVGSVCVVFARVPEPLPPQCVWSKKSQWPLNACASDTLLSPRFSNTSPFASWNHSFRRSASEARTTRKYRALSGSLSRRRLLELLLGASARTMATRTAGGIASGNNRLKVKILRDHCRRRQRPNQPLSVG